MIKWWICWRLDSGALLRTIRFRLMNAMHGIFTVSMLAPGVQWTEGVLYLSGLNLTA